MTEDTSEDGVARVETTNKPRKKLGAASRCVETTVQGARRTTEGKQPVSEGGPPSRAREDS